MSASRFHLVRPRVGEVACGDGAIVRDDGPRTLLAVVDALGHGPLAAEVTAQALACLAQVALEGGPAAVQSELNDALRGTRGAAAMVCLIEGERISGCGVGNVELRTDPNGVPVVLSPGILGSSVRTFRRFEGIVPWGSRLVLFSDGISATRLRLDELRALDAEKACRSILQRFAYPHDDASVLVADMRAP